MGDRRAENMDVLVSISLPSLTLKLPVRPVRSSNPSAPLFSSVLRFIKVALPMPLPVLAVAAAFGDSTATEAAAGLVAGLKSEEVERLSREEPKPVLALKNLVGPAPGV